MRGHMETCCRQGSVVTAAFKPALNSAMGPVRPLLSALHSDMQSYTASSSPTFLSDKLHVVLVFRSKIQNCFFCLIAIFLFQIQGGIMLASLTQLIVGTTGLLGFLLRFIGPLTIAPTITLVGLSLFEVAMGFCAANWGMAML